MSHGLTSLTASSLFLELLEQTLLGAGITLASWHGERSMYVHLWCYTSIYIYICQIMCHVFFNIYNISYIITIYRHLHVSACGLHALQDMFCIFQQHSDPRQVLRWLERTVLQDPSPLHTLGPRLTKPAKELESTTLMVGSLSPKKFTQKPNGDSQFWERWQAMQHSSKRILERWWTVRLRGTLWLMTNKNHLPQRFISLRLGNSKGIQYNPVNSDASFQINCHPGHAWTCPRIMLRRSSQSPDFSEFPWHLASWASPQAPHAKTRRSCPASTPEARK